MRLSTEKDGISDEQILEAFKKRSAIGMELFLKKYERDLFFHLRSILRSDEDTDDAYQNSCVKIFLNIHRFKGNSKLYTWAYRIATNEALALLRKRKKSRTEDASALNSQRAETNADYDQLIEVFHRAINSLPPRQQLVFQMRYYGDKSYEEIAEITNRSVGGLKANFHHARKKIEEYIKKNNHA